MGGTMKSLRHKSTGTIKKMKKDPKRSSPMYKGIIMPRDVYNEMKKAGNNLVASA
jgi:hypothetical protein